MGFPAVVLSQLERCESDRIVTEYLQRFDWMMVFLYGSEDASTVSLSNIQNLIPDLATISNGGKILFVDFLQDVDNMRSYLYSEARDHYPYVISKDTLKSIQTSYELCRNKDNRVVLEKLFFQVIFDGSLDFHPCFIAVNLRYKYAITRNFTNENIDEKLLDFILEGITLIQKESASFFQNGSLAANFLNPFKTAPHLNYLSTSYNFDSAIANFLDLVDDAISCDEDDASSHEPLNLSPELQLKTTSKFYRSFNCLDNNIKGQAITVIKRLIKGHISGLNIKKINISKHNSFYRMKINDKYRIHFQGQLEQPILINVGAHKLFEFGYKID
jgi:hypothetical protein